MHTATHFHMSAKLTCYQLGSLSGDTFLSSCCRTPATDFQQCVHAFGRYMFQTQSRPFTTRANPGSVSSGWTTPYVHPVRSICGIIQITHTFLAWTCCMDPESCCTVFAGGGCTQTHSSDSRGLGLQSHEHRDPILQSSNASVQCSKN